MKTLVSYVGQQINLRKNRTKYKRQGFKIETKTSGNEGFDLKVKMWNRTIFQRKISTQYQAEKAFNEIDSIIQNIQM